MSQGLWIAVAVVAVLVVIAALVLGLVRYRRRRITFTAKPEPGAIDRSGGYTASSGIAFSQTATADRLDTTGLPAVGDDATIPRDAPRRTISEVELPEPETLETPAPPPVAPAPPHPPAPEPPPAAPEIEAIAPPEGRLERLRGRLARSQNALGRSVLGLIGGGDLDEDAWQDVEDTLLVADLGPVVTESVMAQLRARLAGSDVRTEADAKAVLRDVLIRELHPDMDRSIRALPHDDHPSVLLVVGVNGTGKTTTVGKLARVLVADGRRVVLGAADTFRAAAADQLQTWASRVGAEVVRGPEGADPASVAFDAVDKGIASGADVVLIDTAGRLHTKVGLMDELDKVKRVVTRRAAVDEVLLVLDATIGQNGLAQARVFAEVVEITGAVLTKLDGTAKGGIVFRVQQELGVPVKLVGLGEGPDDLAPFEPGAFVDALLG
ncbi:signal recognition particle-docking protein FtsY [Mycobacterium sp. 852014-50255_SCH5639931]|uniref:signal recognition particle-docking protein FtsY n=1 Tax=Mycobacterium sp. 852014-50255_SCH5639931 TaxID=1834112 RepID=UPI000800332D|nr:signal recognition particle-docking protein FtsY [Mycobacterium sp. 852014-50255_SCH5639931]OBB63865.1 signal recognition particle-docking protein FtsY [Mycobacterium sp. 852014-50255_SCH5639931]